MGIKKPNHSHSLTPLKHLQNQLKNHQTQTNDCVNWNFNYMLALGSTITLATLLVFQASNTTLDASANTLVEKPELARYNLVAKNVAYNDIDAIADIAKSILDDKVHPLSSPMYVRECFDKYVYELEDYVIDIYFNPNLGLGEHDVKMTIQTKNTYSHGEVHKLDAQNIQNDNNILEGLVYTYYPKINVVDEVAPIISCSTSMIEMDDTDSFDIHDYVQAYDEVDGQIDFQVFGMFNEIEEGRYEAGDYTLTITASDRNGNSSSVTLDVVVNDTRVVEPVYGDYGVSPYAGSIVAEARSHIGKSYVWGAEGPYAFDCSGLVKYVYGRAGVYLPHSSGALASVGVAINPYDRSAWRAGDIVVYNNHVAIYSGNNTLIHALNERLGIRETAVSTYINGPIIAVRRVL